MKKDIEFSIAENVYAVAIREWDKDFLAQHWNVYLVNNRKDTIEAVLVMSRGNNETKKTSTLRHGLGSIQSKKASKIELITDEVLGFRNEYLITFFAEGKLFERDFVFEPYSISEENTIEIGVLQAQGIVAK